MSEEVERYAVRKVLDNQTEMIKNLMESMEWTEEQAMAALKLSDKEKVTLQKSWKTNKERLMSVMNGPIFETASDMIKIQMIIEMGRECGLDDAMILKKMQKKIIALSLTSAKEYLDQYDRQLV